MEELKNIVANDKDEKLALEFLLMDKAKWEIKENKDDIKLSYGWVNMENPLNHKKEEKICFCLDVNFKKPIQTVFNYLNDLNLRKNFDSLYSEAKLISSQTGNPEIYEYYLLLKMGFVFSNRDFVIQRKVWKDYNGKKDHYLIHIISKVHKDYPEVSNPVRGIFFNRAAYLIPQANGQDTKLILCNCLDMNMINIANFMTINKGTEGMLNWLKKFREALNNA